MLNRNWLRAVALFVVLALASAQARAETLQSKIYSYLSAATTNSTLVYGDSQALLQWLLAVNTTSTVYYLKLYNKATAPTCGTDTPVMRIPLPASTTGGGALPIHFDAAQFPLGIGFCLTGALADNDTTSAATGVVLNFGVVWQ